LRNLNLTEARLEGNIKSFGNLVYSFALRGPKKAKEYISQWICRGNRTRQQDIFKTNKNAKIFYFLSCMRVYGRLSSTPQLHPDLGAFSVLSFCPQFVEYAPVF